MNGLQITWYVIVGVLLTGYAILDGFDLGAGFWHLFARKDEHRRLVLNAIGPVWDGNEVWLLAGGGAIFAAFPPVYATVFSGMYVALVLLLGALIARAVAIEFRGKVRNECWRRGWDAAFAFGSVTAGLLLGIALGNVMRGVPLDAAGNHAGGFFSLLNPFSLLIGLCGTVMFATHGALYITIKTEGELGASAAGWAKKAWTAYAVLYLGASAWGIGVHAHLRGNFDRLPALWLVPVAAVAAMGLIPVFLRSGAVVKAFVASSAAIALHMATVGACLFPRLVPASNDAALSLTAGNSSSSEKTLRVMLVLALIGMPLVIGYTVFAYRTFRGKVKLHENSY
ncbi:MAG: cytochrome d ubiquinol oxidase subunit II [Deltaproteobacteria bacterium]|nr:cytochrome d ubiquinol oxidase subunit II [Deltaproteobacteria bacterium]